MVVIMMYEYFINDIVNRNALIVHCSRPGKGDTEGKNLFPEDMKIAIDILSNTERELSCSVIWPGHNKTFGDVGIIIKPKNIESVVRVNSSDAGTYYDINTGKRNGLGKPLNKESMLDTFVNSTDYNEWVIKNSDTIGIYVKDLHSPLEVACKYNLPQNDENELYFCANEFIGTMPITIEIIKQIFNGYPIYTLDNNKIIGFDGLSVSPYEK